MTHTPGPWTADAHGFIYANADSELPDNANQGACIVVAKVLKHSSKRPLANSRLIAAAPDLLEALESNLEYLELKAQGFAAQYPPDHCINLTVFRQLEQTREAIRKAKGE
jgi:hypothetical protein